MPNRLPVILTANQRLDLFKATGKHISHVVFQEGTGWTFGDKSCSRCLLHDGLTSVEIDASGLCNHCRDFDIEERALLYSKDTLFKYVRDNRGHSQIDSVVAYSGGKDSAAALLVAIQDLGLRPVAVMVDNGFIPEEIKEEARTFTKKAGVELQIKNISIKEITKGLLKEKFKDLPCSTCIRKIFDKVRAVADSYGTKLVIGGHRFPPLAFRIPTLTPSYESSVVCVSPLLGFRVSEREQLSRIESFGWQKPNIPGNTSNCKLIGFMEQVHYDNHGYNPHIYEVSKEIRAGFYSREVGMEKIARPDINETERDFIFERLGTV